jgi:hypothetical protein
MYRENEVLAGPEASEEREILGYRRSTAYGDLTVQGQRFRSAMVGYNRGKRNSCRLCLPGGTTARNLLSEEMAKSRKASE